MIKIFEHEMKNTKAKVGHIQLASPQTLNALGLNDFNDIFQALQTWKEDESIQWVWVDSLSEKAFSAGGDVKSLALKKDDKDYSSFCKNFFQKEYKTDNLIRNYSKPIVSWCHGITMGGGLGLINGARHRVATEKTIMAMPEITIGLFPDVGATYFYGQLENELGLFLALTGARLPASWACELSFFDHQIPHTQKSNVFQDLLNMKDPAQISEILEFYQKQKGTEDQRTVPFDRKQCEELVQGQSLSEIHQNFLDIKSGNDFLQKRIETYKRGCRLSDRVIERQFKNQDVLTPEGAYLKEWGLAVKMTGQKDFQEGVRSLLIDKDQNPQWEYSHFEEVPEEVIQEIFEPA